jgi:4-diphosphocytidyl-2-C-methyl-D-erythritol kinase
MLGLEATLRKRRPMKKPLSIVERLRMAAAVGSDLPLFLVGGAVLGVGRGEEVYPLADFPATAMVVVTPHLGVATPRAFSDWDDLVEREIAAQPRAPRSPGTAQLTHSGVSDRLFEVGCALSAWLGGYPDAGAPAKSGGRAGNLLSDLVRTGIENDFERVVFPKFPELRDIKRALVRAGSRYASLSGSGSTVYGLFESEKAAVKAARALREQGLAATATRTLTRHEYRKWQVLRDR